MRLSDTIDNQALLAADQQLLGNPATHIMTIQVNDIFVKSGGCGLTIGLLIARNNTRAVHSRPDNRGLYAVRQSSR